MQIILNNRKSIESEFLEGFNSISSVLSQVGSTTPSIDIRSNCCLSLRPFIIRRTVVVICKFTCDVCSQKSYLIFVSSVSLTFFFSMFMSLHIKIFLWDGMEKKTNGILKSPGRMGRWDINVDLLYRWCWWGINSRDRRRRTKYIFHPERSTALLSPPPPSGLPNSPNHDPSLI